MKAIVGTSSCASELHVGTGYEYTTIQAAADVGLSHSRIIIHNDTSDTSVTLTTHTTLVAIAECTNLEIIPISSARIGIYGLWADLVIRLNNSYVTLINVTCTNLQFSMPNSTSIMSQCRIYQSTITNTTVVSLITNADIGTHKFTIDFQNSILALQNMLDLGTWYADITISNCDISLYLKFSTADLVDLTNLTIKRSNIHYKDSGVVGVLIGAFATLTISDSTFVFDQGLSDANTALIMCTRNSASTYLIENTKFIDDYRKIPVRMIEHFVTHSGTTAPTFTGTNNQIPYFIQDADDSTLVGEDEATSYSLPLITSHACNSSGGARCMTLYNEGSDAFTLTLLPSPVGAKITIIPGVTGPATLVIRVSTDNDLIGGVMCEDNVTGELTYHDIALTASSHVLTFSNSILAQLGRGHIVFTKLQTNWSIFGIMDGLTTEVVVTTP